MALNMDGVKGMCEKHANVRIEKLIYPSNPGNFKRTCLFQSTDDKKYRIEPDAFCELHALGHGVSAHEKLGGLDGFHTYTIWVKKTTRDKRGDTLHHVYYATHKPQELSAGLIKEMLRSVGENPSMALGLGENPTWTSVRASMKGEKLPAAIRTLEASVPYIRMRLSRRLFRLFPESTLMEMGLADFLKLAKALTDVKDAQTGEKLVAGLCFPWLRENQKFPSFNIEGLFALERHYRFSSATAMSTEQWQSLMLCLEFFQKSLSQNKSNGHTFATIEQLAHAYQQSIQWEERTKPTARHVVGSKRSLTFNDTVVGLKSHTSKAIALGIVKVQVVPVSENQPRVPKNMQRVLYAGDDWLMQEFCVSRIADLAARWDRAKHADGCRTASDVRARIDAARPPSDRGAGPNWQSQDFQDRWRTLDDRQQQAVINAILSPVTFVVGPPGTGKTEVFSAVKALFQADDSVAMAAYGKIAKMVDDRIGNAFTFHRAEAIVAFRSGTQTATTLLESRNVFGDEFGLITHEHLSRLFNKIGDKKARLLLAGDMHQMGGIGSGSIIGSIYRRFSNDSSLFTVLDVPHRFLPNYGVGMTRADVNRACQQKPSDPSDPMAVAWNMKQIRDYPLNERLDLVVGSGPDDRFVVIPEGDTVEATLDNIEAFGLNSQRLMSLDCQILTHTNKMRHDICKAVRARIPGLPMQQHRFALREKITFKKNKYFEQDGDDTSGATPTGDVALNYSELRADAGSVRKRSRSALTFDYGDNAEKQRPSKKNKKHHNVFNGDVKEIKDIVDVNKKDEKVVRHIQDTGERTHRGTKRIVHFTDNSTVDFNEYDPKQVESAIAITAVKFQGSENETVPYWYTPSGHIRRDQLYTSMTRAKRQFIWIGGKTKREALRNIETVASADPTPRRERFAFHLDLESSA